MTFLTYNCQKLKKMKIYCNIDLDGRNFEGRTQLALAITKYLQDQGYTFTNDPAEADLIHFHSSGIGDSYRAYQLKRKYNLPVIYSLYSNAQTSWLMHPINFLIQGIYFQKTATKFLASYSAAIPLRWRAHFLQRLDKVIVPSTYLKQKLYPNTEVITLGVNPEKYKPLEKKQAKKAKAVKIAYFGHPGVFKGLNDFVQASKLFGKELETHVFLTQRFEKVDQYIQKHNPQIKIHGFVEDLVAMYNEMDIIVLPYRMEIGTVANPLVLLEAMACGKAIITTDHEFIKEIVQDSAIVVKKNSPHSIAKAVQSLAKDLAQRKNVGEGARKIVVERYNLTKMLEKYHQLYQAYEKK
ncbi:MAG: hypothetical protein A2822_04460 [Candidatus Staskawiczbacteria bacterium RIFCSPHIGHO2_01_FULL_41_41]|uniref:Glycosyl transferase family 1 domain-containing protein n=1 Tax=Candidatus Staskawiczbacteria bacterium RIFCSPHIGHO2_01_FULL_41_41 TaxID=1802203 RepID=A0A1G2HS62_9BACT|nr:MAG: hypothetical protein A2822_04460 [Candidatus Staskawiczbacteria bacterium RIFCSPHIGHO2_01_FULL_41_41]